MEKEKKALEYRWEHGPTNLYMTVTTYACNDHLSITFESEEDGMLQPFGALTVNLPDEALNPNEAFIDHLFVKANLDLIERYQLGTILPEKACSGLCEFFKVAFDLDRLAVFDPDGVAEYRERMLQIVMPKTDSKTKLIERKCPMCGKRTFLKITKKQNQEYANYVVYGGRIQDKLKSFDKFGREFVKTEYCPACQELLYDSEIKNKEDYFYEEDLRCDVIENFIVNTKGMKASDALHSDAAKQLSENEKLLFMYEFELEE